MARRWAAGRAAAIAVPLAAEATWLAAAAAGGAGSSAASASSTSTAAGRDSLLGGGAYDAWDREPDWYYGASAYKDLYGSGRLGDYFGGYGGAYGGYADYYRSEKKEGGGAQSDDECSRLEANGVLLAEALREAATALGSQPLSQAAPQIQQLVAFFTDPGSEKQRRLLLGSCPQAVALAFLLRAEAASGPEVARQLTERLSESPTMRAPYRPPPQWSGAPWEAPLSAAQQRSGVVLFPIGEQQFQVEYIAPANWTINPRRRCAGRRDLGNLQATPLEKCLAKCAAHPLCRSATFWHWQPGGFGFEQRCFLSSSCTVQQAKAEGADGAVMFEKRAERMRAEEETLMKRTVMTPRGGAPWAPRCGHSMVAGTAASPGGLPTLWLMGGVGVDPFANVTVAAPSPAGGSGTSELAATLRAAGGGKGAAAYPALGGWRSPGAAPGQGADRKRGGRPGAAGGVAASPTPPPAGRSAARRRESNVSSSNVIEAYLSRHVELNGELPPLRSLPYGRLGDVWRSTDLGASWTMVTKSAPWGQRAFFGACTIRGGAALVLLGGVSQPAGEEAGRAHDAVGGALLRAYQRDVWVADLAGGGAATWTLIGFAPWAARASFQAVSRPSGRGLREGDAASEELLVLGGRLASGKVSGEVWSGLVPVTADLPSTVDWRLVTGAASWEARSDFAAVVQGPDVFLFGGRGADGRPLADVWRSADGKLWQEVLRAAPWGPRVGPSAVALPAPAGGGGGDAAPLGAIVLFGGYAYPDDGTEPVSARASEGEEVWAAASWATVDGTSWQALGTAGTSWTPNNMHAAVVPGPCRDVKAKGAENGTLCAYASGGLTHEGYYDNTVHRIIVAPSTLAPAGAAAPASQTPTSRGAASGRAANASRPSPRPAVAPRDPVLPLVAFGVSAMVLLASSALLGLCGTKSRPSQNGAGSPELTPPLDPRVRAALLCLFALCVLGGCLVAAGVVTVLRLAEELKELKAEKAQCHIDDEAAGKVGDMLGLRRLTDQWDQLQTLLRLASRESQFSYSAYDASRGGTAGRTSDYYAQRDRYNYWGGLDNYGYGGGYGGYGGYGDDALYGDADASAGGGHSSLARELAMLPTTQSLACRSPRCDRNASTCARQVARSFATPYGCCSDYMLLMLADVTEWLRQQNIPYFITYGTLLGAVREGDILPYTQDMDIVVDRSHWPQLQRGLEAADFFGGRRYLFGLDQWEERVSRICADWEGFASSAIGGDGADRLVRGTEFHLDVYASDWWQISDLHLVDCVEPLGLTEVQIRGLNFSAPALPRACLEKLYGVEWRTPKHALSGVN